jgi:hypothetical protein
MVKASRLRGLGALIVFLLAFHEKCSDIFSRNLKSCVL